MAPLNLNLQELIAQIDQDLADSDTLAKVTEARQRANNLAAFGDQLIDHFVNQARNAGMSWSQIGGALGVTKQAAQQRWMMPTFSRFTARARQAVLTASEMARRLGHPMVGPEHVILGLLAEEQGAAAQVMASLAGSAEAVRRRVAQAIAAGAPDGGTATVEALAAEVPVPGATVPGSTVSGAPTSGDPAAPSHIPFGPEPKDAMRQALAQALELGHNYIGTEHLLLGLLNLPNGQGARLLSELGITYDAARAGVLEWIEKYVAAKREQSEES